MERKAKIIRKTKETDIQLNINLDGKGKSEINTGIPFIDHMLDLFSAHGFMDIKLIAKGDTEIDYHHTVEDLGICFGDAISKAIGERKGIRRYGHAIVPMDESLACVVVDICNRPYLAYRVSLKNRKTGNFDTALIKEFFRAMVNHSGITMHVDLLAGKDPHHAIEAIFKAFGKALDTAISTEERLKGGVPSTKGML